MCVLIMIFYIYYVQIKYFTINNFFHFIALKAKPKTKREIATNTTSLIPLFNFTLFNFTLKILIDKVPLYPWIIKPKLLFLSQFQIWEFPDWFRIRRWSNPTILTSSPDGAGEFSGGFDGADEFSDEAEKLYKLRRTRRSLTFSSIEK